MIIDFNAFKNCKSLKELHFENCSSAICTNIYQYDCDLPKDFKIIIPDNLVDVWNKVEKTTSIVNLISYSDYIKSNVIALTNGKVILSIIYIRKAIECLSNDIKKSLVELINTIYAILNISEQDIILNERYLNNHKIKL